MPSVDVEDVLAKLGSEVFGRSGKEIIAFCPDHHLFVGRNPSHPNWVINVETGETFCHTEGRGSNLVWIVCRLFDCKPKEAVKFLTGIQGDVDVGKLELTALSCRYDKIKREAEKEKPIVKGLESVRQDMEKPYMSDEAYQFFIHPPERELPTNILLETVNRYRVFQRTWGQYTNRVIIPFFMRGELVGFSALDMLGQKKWIDKHPLKTEDDYKKTLYPMNFQSGLCLFGFDDCQKRADMLFIVEGPREVMKLTQEGFPNAVAMLGSYLSDNHFELITELAPKRIILMFDGNEVGKEITIRTAFKLSRLYRGDSLKKCFLPNGYDPKNLDRNGIEQCVFGE
jgi:hypothetical protein